MNIREGTERKVSFNTRDELGDKIDKLTVVMSRLAAKDSHEKRPFKPQIYKSRAQNQSYNQESFQNRTNSRNRGQYTSSGPNKTIETNFQGNSRGYGRQNDRGGYRNDRHNDYNRGIIEAGIDQEKGHSQEIIVVAGIDVHVTVDLGQVLELVQR